MNKEKLIMSMRDKIADLENLQDLQLISNDELVEEVEKRKEINIQDRKEIDTLRKD